VRAKRVNSFVVLGDLGDRGGRSVRARVVDHQDLVLDPLPLEHLDHRFQGRGDPVDFVASGDYDRELHR